MTNDDIHDRLAAYGVRFEGEQGYTPTELEMDLTTLALMGGRITRVRWIGGDYIPGRGKCYDLSYVHGQVTEACGDCDGRGCDKCSHGEVTRNVRIAWLPAAFLIPRREMKTELIRWAREARVNAKALGLLDNFSILG